MPTTDTAWPDGTPCWVDYCAPDADAARAFYSRVFGWEFSGGSPETGGYDNARLGGREAAGLYPLIDPGQTAGWRTYFATSDAAATVERAAAAGGAVVAPAMEVGPLGSMAVLRDPQGVEFGVWQAGLHIGVRVFNEPGALVWNEAAVPDPAAARAFYGDVFGFSFDEVPGVPGYATFRTADRPLGGVAATSPDLPTGWSACFSVASTDEAVAVTQEAGGTVLLPATDMEFGRYAVLGDPWAAPFTVMQEPAA